MLAFTAYTGARRGEVIRSQIDDIDFQQGQITLRERKRRKDRAQTFRFVPLHSRLRVILQDWFRDHPGGQYSFIAPLEMERGSGADLTLPSPLPLPTITSSRR